MTRCYVPQALISITKPYKRVKLSFLAQELSLTVAEVEKTLSLMILDKKMNAMIDQIDGYAELLGDVETLAIQKMNVLSKYSDSLDTLFDGYANRYVL